MASKKITQSKSPKATKKSPAKNSASEAAAGLPAVQPRSIQLYGNVCVAVASTILLASSLFWAIFSARLQSINADQLIDSDMFQSWNVFHQASFPGAHTFLLKWPLFTLANFFGNTATVTILLTVACAIIPVVALVLLLMKIEKRPVVFALWCLALSSVLLLVPAQPSPGALLPVNFAMLTTRNVEYALFLLVLVGFIRTTRWRDRRLWWAAAGAALLITSDKLFAPLLLGAVVLLYIGRCIRRRVRNCHDVMSPRQLRWLAASASAYVVALVVLQAIHYWHITGITDQGVSPYAVVLKPKLLIEAAAYAVISIMTLYGANPAYADRTLTAWPNTLAHGMAHISNVGYIVNMFILLAVTLGSAAFLWTRWRRKAALKGVDWMALFLLVATSVAVILYVCTNHYYPVDSRYLTICFFALFVAAAVWLRDHTITLRWQRIAAAILVVSLPVSFVASYHQYQLSHEATTELVAFQKNVAAQIVDDKVGTLIGDYWDVTPIRSLSRNDAEIVPLTSCTAPQGALLSTAWQHDKAGTRIAYLLDTHPPAAAFGACSLTQVEKFLGTPTRLIKITNAGHEGTWLLVYDAGVQHIVSQPKSAADS